MLPKMWTKERFGYEGEFFSMPTRAVLPEAVPEAAPADVGRRHRPGTELDAADRGMGGLGVTFAAFAEQEQMHRRVPPPHPALRAGRRVRQRPGRLASTSSSATRTRRPASRPAASMIGTFQYLAGQLDMAKEA